MKLPIPDKNYISSFILITIACILLIMVTVTDRRDLTSAAVVISGMVLFLTGIFLLTFTKDHLIDGRISALLPVQGTITICRMASDLGILGSAVFLPADKTDHHQVMQFDPVSSYRGATVEGDLFVSGPGGTGLLIPPSGEVLLTELKTRNHLIIPDSEDEILSLIRETGENILEISDAVLAERTGNGISVIMENYRLLDGCLRLSEESPACCTMHPCPVCSLFGMIITEGLNQGVQVERCRPDKKRAQVEILYSLLS